MADLKYDPVPHNQKAFLEKASKRHGFREAYAALEAEYALAHEMLSARRLRENHGVSMPFQGKLFDCAVQGRILVQPFCISFIRLRAVLISGAGVSCDFLIKACSTTTRCPTRKQ